MEAIVLPSISVAPSGHRLGRRAKVLAMATAPQGERPNPWRFLHWKKGNNDQIVLKEGDPKQGNFGYKVRPGENLHDIAAKFNTRAEILMEANNILNPKNVAAGELLWIPRTHEIGTGDTLYSLARKLKTKVSEIQAANGIENPDVIYIGDVILIPDIVNKNKDENNEKNKSDQLDESSKN